MGPEICISNKVPGDTEAAGQWTTHFDKILEQWFSKYGAQTSSSSSSSSTRRLLEMEVRGPHL